jgi:hypothetical protein
MQGACEGKARLDQSHGLINAKMLLKNCAMLLHET